jgi:hypothetical protein
MHWMPCALDFALDKAGNSMAAKIAIMAMTTSNSINVNPGGHPEPDVLFTLTLAVFIDLFMQSTDAAGDHRAEIRVNS